MSTVGVLYEPRVGASTVMPTSITAVLYKGTSSKNTWYPSLPLSLS